MKIVNLSQGSQEWLDWRGRGVGASEASVLYNGEEIEIPYTPEEGNAGSGIAVVTGNPFSTRYQLWAMKTGRMEAPDLSGNPNVQRGNRVEPVAREAANRCYGELAVPVLGEDDDMPHLRASFDGIFSDGSVLEVKVPSAKGFAKCKAEGPQPYYIPQVADQMAVCKADVGRLFVYSEDGEYLSWRFDNTGAMADLIADVRVRVDRFWRKHVLMDMAPELDPLRDILDLSGSKDWATLANAWRRVKADEARAKAQADEAAEKRKVIESDLSKLAGGFGIAEGADLRFSQFTRAGSVDYGRVLADLYGDVSKDDLDAYRRKASSGVKVTDQSA